MSDLDKILLTAATTIVGSVFVYALGQVMSKFIIEPMQELRKVIAECRFNLAFYATAIHTPISRTPQRSEEAYRAVMKSSCDLLAKSEVIAFRRFAPLGTLPPASDVATAAKKLRGLTTYLHETGTKASDHIDEVIGLVGSIETLLRLKTLD